MKIIYFITKSNWGGAQKYVFDLATNAALLGHDVMVILGGTGLLKQNLDAAGIRTVSLLSLGRDVSAVDDFKSALETYTILLKEKPDVIHLNSAKSGMVAVMARIAGVRKIIYTAHGWAFNENRSFLSKTLIKFLYYITILLSHRVIAVSQKIIDQVASWPFNKRKIQRIYPAARAPEFLSKEVAREYFIQKCNMQVPSDAKWFISLGELHPIKGHTYALHACKMLSEGKPNTKFVYVIIGGGELKEKLQQEIRDLGLENNVFLSDYLEHAATYLKAADFYIFPSLSEGLPYAVVEAGHAGVPTLSSRVGGIPEIIDDGVNGLLFDSKSPEAIYEKIGVYLGNPGLAASYAQALSAKISKTFSVENMVHETLEIYK